MITEDVAGIGETLDTLQTVLLKEIVTDAVHSGANILRTLKDVIRMGRDGTTPWYGNTAVAAARLTPPVQICHSTTDLPIRNRNQDNINPIGPVITQWIRNAEKPKTSIDGFFCRR